jgi:CRP-like cAMP-binding protein
MGWDGMVGLSLLFFEKVSNTTVFVQVPGSATRVRADAFVRHVRDEGGPLFRQLQRYGNAFMAMVAQTAACNSLHSMDERICRWILITHDRVQRDEFSLTHEFLAAMLGVRRATVSVEADRLQQAGLINYQRGQMRITNREGLEDSVCECYGIINQMFDRVFGGWPEKQRQNIR